MRLGHLLSKESEVSVLCVFTMKPREPNRKGEGEREVSCTQESLANPSRKAKDEVRNRLRTWGFSSAGRAPALHAGGQEFESLNLHHSISKEM